MVLRKSFIPVLLCWLLVWTHLLTPSFLIAQEAPPPIEANIGSTPDEWLATFDRLQTTNLSQATESLNRVRAQALETDDVDSLFAYAQRVIAHFRYADDLPQIIQELEAFQARNQDQLTPPQRRYLQLVLATLHIQDQSDLDEAKRILMQLDQDAELNKHQATVKKTLGDLYQTLGQYPQALSAYTEALRLNSAPEFQVRIYKNLGNVASFLEDWNQAIGHYLRAIDLYETLGYVIDQVAVWANLGPSYRANDEPEKALEVYLAGIEALEGLDSPDLSAQFQMNLGNLYVDLGRVDDALGALGTSLSLCEAEGFDYCVMLNHLNIGYAAYMDQDYARAQTAYDQAARFLERIADPYVERQLMDNYADLYRDLGDYATALQYAD